MDPESLHDSTTVSSFLNGQMNLLLPRTRILQDQIAHAAEVVGVVELLQLICEKCDEETLRTCVTVCKQWSEVALDVLWREVWTIKMLLKPLGEIIKSQEYNSRTRSYYYEYVRYTMYYSITCTNSSVLQNNRCSLHLRPTRNG